MSVQRSRAASPPSPAPLSCSDAAATGANVAVVAAANAANAGAAACKDVSCASSLASCPDGEGSAAAAVAAQTRPPRHKRRRAVDTLHDRLSRALTPPDADDGPVTAATGARDGGDEKSRRTRASVCSTVLPRTLARMSALSAQPPLHFVSPATPSPPPSTSVCVSPTAALVDGEPWRRLGTCVLCRVFVTHDEQTATTTAHDVAHDGVAVVTTAAADTTVTSVTATARNSVLSMPPPPSLLSSRVGSSALCGATPQVVFCFIDDVLLAPVAAPRLCTLAPSSSLSPSRDHDDGDRCRDATHSSEAGGVDAVGSVAEERAATPHATAVLRALSHYAQRGYRVVLLDHYPALHHGNATALGRALRPLSRLCHAHVTAALPQLTVVVSMTSNVLPSPSSAAASASVRQQRARAQCTRAEAEDAARKNADEAMAVTHTRSSRNSSSSSSSSHSLIGSTHGDDSNSSRRRTTARRGRGDAVHARATTTSPSPSSPCVSLVEMFVQHLNASLRPDVTTSFVVGTCERTHAFYRDTHRHLAADIGLRYVDVCELLATTATNATRTTTTTTTTQAASAPTAAVPLA